MKKTALFISAGLTAFVLTIVAGSVVAAKFISNNTSVASTSSQNIPIVAVATEAPTQATITPEQAAQIAAQALGRTDLYSVDITSLNGLTVYAVTFSSGDVAYVDAYGQMLGVVPAVNFSSQQAQPSHDDDHDGDHD